MWNAPLFSFKKKTHNWEIFLIYTIFSPSFFFFFFLVIINRTSLLFTGLKRSPLSGVIKTGIEPFIDLFALSRGLFLKKSTIRFIIFLWAWFLWLEWNVGAKSWNAASFVKHFSAQLGVGDQEGKDQDRRGIWGESKKMTNPGQLPEGLGECVLSKGDKILAIGWQFY